MAHAASSLAIQSVSARGVRVAIRFILGTSAASVPAVPLVLVDLHMTDGRGGS